MPAEPPQTGRERLHVYIRGRVQGVWFRESTRRRALELGLSGWVKNLRDGRVEALFEGEPSAIEDALAFVSDGPPHARVLGVEIVSRDRVFESGRVDERRGPSDGEGERADRLAPGGFEVR